ncbi:hypothetical protein [Blastomonas sp.]|uniref:hypothetical protein n=1 Tax=Blastomonas sp. TaxID=1909299 RepID=UPI003593538C
MPDINQLFQLHQLATQRAIHADCADERASQHALALGYAAQLDGLTYPQAGSFMLD